MKEDQLGLLLGSDKRGPIHSNNQEALVSSEEFLSKRINSLLYQVTISNLSILWFRCYSPPYQGKVVQRIVHSKRKQDDLPQDIAGLLPQMSMIIESMELGMGRSHEQINVFWLIDSISK